MSKMIVSALALLGCDVKDKVTGFKGMASSACFDTYGCIQIAVTPPVDAEGKTRDGQWFDVKRLEVGKRVMDEPEFGQQEFQKVPGPAEKPPQSRQY